MQSIESDLFSKLHAHLDGEPRDQIQELWEGMDLEAMFQKKVDLEEKTCDPTITTSKRPDPERSEKSTYSPVRKKKKKTHRHSPAKPSPTKQSPQSKPATRSTTTLYESARTIVFGTSSYRKNQFASGEGTVSGNSVFHYDLSNLDSQFLSIHCTKPIVKIELFHNEVELPKLDWMQQGEQKLIRFTDLYEAARKANRGPDLVVRRGVYIRFEAVLYVSVYPDYVSRRVQEFYIKRMGEESSYYETAGDDGVASLSSSLSSNPVCPSDVCVGLSNKL